MPHSRCTIEPKVANLKQNMLRISLLDSLFVHWGLLVSEDGGLGGWTIDRFAVSNKKGGGAFEWTWYENRTKVRRWPNTR
jgi:hypothetical protein